MQSTTNSARSYRVLTQEERKEIMIGVRQNESALLGGQPEVFNADQGVQFTSSAFTEVLVAKEIQISMDGRGRALDNVFVERLWRSLKYEEVYLKEYETVIEASEGIARYFGFYNEERPHQSLGYRTPADVYGERVCGNEKLRNERRA